MSRKKETIYIVPIISDFVYVCIFFIGVQIFFKWLYYFLIF